MVALLVYVLIGIMVMASATLWENGTKADDWNFTCTFLFYLVYVAIWPISLAHLIWMDIRDNEQS
jgi:hypothetical protein